MSKTKKTRKNHARLIVIVVTIVACLGAVGCFAGSSSLVQQATAAYQARRAQVEAINQARQDEYYLALSEFQQQTTSGANLAWPAQKPTGWDVVVLDNYPLENVSYVTVDRGDVMNNGMLLVNEWHSRPDDFAETNLVGAIAYSEKKLRAKDGNVRAFPVAIDAMMQCIADAAELGYENYALWEGYRSWEYQNELFQKEMEKHTDLTGDAQIARAKQDVNYPGTSEFNSGLSMTVRLYKSHDEAVNSMSFFDSEEGVWMVENSWRYGLVFRFPLADYPVNGTADKSFKTGVSSKLRIFRYVGAGNAAVMHTLDLCLEEYIEFLAEHPHIAVFENGTLRYEIFREYVGDADSFPISVVGSGNMKHYVTSLDNMGYAITVFEY